MQPENLNSPIHHSRLVPGAVLVLVDYPDDNTPRTTKHTIATIDRDPDTTILSDTHVFWTATDTDGKVWALTVSIHPDGNEPFEVDVIRPQFSTDYFDLVDIAAPAPTSSGPEITRADLDRSLQVARDTDVVVTIMDPPITFGQCVEQGLIVLPGNDPAIEMVRDAITQRNHELVGKAIKVTDGLCRITTEQELVALERIAREKPELVSGSEGPDPTFNFTTTVSISYRALANGSALARHADQLVQRVGSPLELDDVLTRMLEHGYPTSFEDTEGTTDEELPATHELTDETPASMATLRQLLELVGFTKEPTDLLYTTRINWTGKGMVYWLEVDSSLRMRFLDGSVAWAERQDDGMVVEGEPIDTIGEAAELLFGEISEAQLLELRETITKGFGDNDGLALVEAALGDDAVAQARCWGMLQTAGGIGR